MNRNVWKLTLAYDGTMFHGWQIQPGVKTIQGTLADAIAAITGERVLPQGAGRTDAGVHATGQVASFPLAAPIPADNFERALNRVLIPAIRVIAAERVSLDFHARHQSLGKIYQYRVFEGGLCSPFVAPYVACSRWSLDLHAMQQAAREILGEHDFTSFAASDPDRSARLMDSTELTPDTLLQDTFDPQTPVFNIRRIDLSQWECISFPASAGSLDLTGILSGTTFADSDREFSNLRSVLDAPEPATRIFTYTVRGNGFLYHMVRNLVGTFLDVGRGRIAPTEIRRILEGRNRALAGPTAPASGLYLTKVLY